MSKNQTFPSIFQQNLNKIFKITDSNADCLYLIFNHLVFNDLLNLAPMSSNFADVTSVIFRRKYSNYEIRIDYLKYEHDKKPYIIMRWPKSIKIRDFEVASNVIKYFGNNIQKLYILNHESNNYTSGSDWAGINRLVNEYGSESLTELKLAVINKKLWPQFTEPFKRVELLEIEIKSDSDGMKLNQLCPSLRKLVVRLDAKSNHDFIDCELPNLNQLDLFFLRSDDYRDKQAISMIKKNPQIRSIVVPQTTPGLNIAIAKYLPNLEYLTFNYDEDEMKEPLHFKNVKHCVLHTNSRKMMKSLSFSSLESFEATYANGELEKFIDFFRRHKTLKRLNLATALYISIDFNAALRDLMNLKEIVLENYSNINIQTMARFVETHPKLRKLQFVTRALADNIRARIQHTFEYDWHIKISFDKTMKSLVALERKEKL